MKFNGLLALAPCVLAVSAVAGCGAAPVTNAGVAGSAAVAQMSTVTGTVFTIVFENHSEDAVLGQTAVAPYFNELAQRYGSAAAYLTASHPSEPNYLCLTSGTTHGIADDGPPTAHAITGTENLASQMLAANVPWRAYMEDMGDACRLTDNGNYAVKHNPFAYYTALTSDAAACQQHVVDFEQNFANDLAANTYKYMWITPNMCNDMHDCSVQTGDEWLRRTVTQIQASPGYQHGGAIFVLFDEGSTTALGGSGAANLATIVISEHAMAPGFRSPITYGHPSYLATMEDIFHLPRLSTTTDASPMADFFVTPVAASSTGTTASANTASTGTGTP